MIQQFKTNVDHLDQVSSNSKYKDIIAQSFSDTSKGSEHKGKLWALLDKLKSSKGNEKAMLQT